MLRRARGAVEARCHGESRRQQRVVATLLSRDAVGGRSLRALWKRNGVSAALLLFVRGESAGSARELHGCSCSKVGMLDADDWRRVGF